MAQKRYFDTEDQVAVGAVQWEGTNFYEILGWAGPEVVWLSLGELWYRGGNDEHKADREDWIVEGVTKDYFAVKPDVFADRYMEIIEDENPLDDEGN